MTDGGVPQDDSAADHSPDGLRASVSPHVFAVDADDRLTTVSESLDALAATTASLSGQHVSSLLAVPSEDLGSHLRTVRRRLEDTETSTVRSTVCRLRAASGRREVSVEFARHPDSTAAVSPVERLVGVVREDVVELGATQPEPGVGPERFRRLFEQLPDPVAEVRFAGDDPLVASVNPAFEEMFGYTEATLIGESLNEYIVPKEADDASRLDREAASGEWTSGEVVREAADGPRLFLFRGIPFTHDGQQCGFGVYTDVTDRESQQRYHEVLNRLLRHNLRNDLNVILGLADQLAAMDSTGAETTALGEQLKQRALDLVETTRRARELQSVIDRSETATAPVPVGQLVAEACDRIQAGYPNVEVGCATERPAVGMAGPALEEAVIELVENAVEHAAAEPTLHLRVETRPDHETVVITVADDGPGIPDDERAVVEGRQSITPLDHGSGLGLWLAKWIVEAYGGELAFAGPDPELGGAAVELRVRRTGADAESRAE